jgi:hypothetical protein
MSSSCQKSDNWSKTKNMCCACYRNCFQAVSLLDQRWMTAQIATGWQNFEKCQLLSTIYSKENGLHVWQLG